MPIDEQAQQTTPQGQPQAQTVSDPAQDILSKTQTDDKSRADAWEIYHNHEGKEFESKLAATSLPQETKAALWNAKTAASGSVYAGSKAGQITPPAGPQPNREMNTVTTPQNFLSDRVNAFKKSYNEDESTGAHIAKTVIEQGEGLAKNLAQISAPGIVTSILNKKAPSAAAHIPGHEYATPAAQLPGQIVQNYALGGGLEGLPGTTGEPEPAPVPEPVAPRPDTLTEESNVNALKKDLDLKQKNYDEAKAKDDLHVASHAEGVLSPAPITKALAKAEAELKESQYHHRTAVNAVEKARAAKATPAPAPQPEVPAEQIEAMPRPGTPKPAAAPENVKTPGQVQPGANPPTGSSNLEDVVKATEEKAKPTGIPKVEAPAEPKAEVPAPKPTGLRDMNKLKVNEKGEVIDTSIPQDRLHELLQKSLEPEAPKANEPAAPKAKEATEAPAEKPAGTHDEKGVRKEPANVRKPGEELSPEAQAVQHKALESVSSLSNDNLDKLAREMGIDASDPIYSRAKEMRGEGREQTGRIRQANAILERMNSEEILKAAAKADQVNGDAASANWARAKRAAAVFEERLSGAPEEGGFGAKNKLVSKEEADVAAAKTEKQTPLEAAVEKTPEGAEKRTGERRQETTPVANERRTGTGERRNAAGLRVDAEGNPTLSPDVEGHWQAGAFGEKPVTDIGAKAREANPEPTRAETKGETTEPTTVGGQKTVDTAKSDNEHFANAKKELGDKASIREIADRAQELKDRQTQADAHNENGGSTFHPTKGNLDGKPFFSVGGEPEFRDPKLKMTTDGKSLTAAQLDEFSKRPEVKAALDKHKDASIGSWFDQETGKTTTELVKTPADRDEAIAMGIKNGEKAIWDLKNREEIKTGGTGEGPAKATPDFNMIKDADGKPDRLEITHNGEPMGHLKIEEQVPGTWTIKDAAVKPGEQGKGFGKAAHLQAFDEALKAGAKTVESDVSNSSKENGVWESIKKDYPEAVTEENGQYSMELSKLGKKSPYGKIK